MAAVFTPSAGGRSRLPHWPSAPSAGRGRRFQRLLKAGAHPSPVEEFFRPGKKSPLCALEPPERRRRGAAGRRARRLCGTAATPVRGKAGGARHMGGKAMVESAAYNRRELLKRTGAAVAGLSALS